MGEHWTQQDLVGTRRVLDDWWAMLCAGHDQAVLDKPGPHGLSVAALRARSGGLVEDGEPTAETIEAALAALSTAGRVRAALGAGSPTARGTVVGLHVSNGGVPKAPVERARIGRRGLDGDRQASRKHHGRVWQALCLWSAEVIAALVAEGHPVAAGNAGENVTIGGVDWATLRPGSRLRIGAALAEVSLPALPCKKNARWFVDGHFMRMYHGDHPAETRWYATVIEPGETAVGDAVIVEPAQAP